MSHCYFPLWEKIVLYLVLGIPLIKWPKRVLCVCYSYIFGNQITKKYCINRIVSINTYQCLLYKFFLPVYVSVGLHIHRWCLFWESLSEEAISQAHELVVLLVQHSNKVLLLTHIFNASCNYELILQKNNQPVINTGRDFIAVPKIKTNVVTP